ncbi:hypothetical protein [Delftia acidovorans]|uniref:hypothetical protein n=1 Tax=Delftia acidovorans TaxID=80866 RepID=UPI0028E9D173|nr:hypothetical protein [Delftia acidovorans]
MNHSHDAHDLAHDLGLQHDLQVMARRLFDRRRMLGLMASGGAVALLSACGGGGDSSDSTGTGTGTGVVVKSFRTFR